MELRFYKKERTVWLPETGRLEVYLKVDNWNDYNYHTLYAIILFDENGTKFDLGYVKIANFGQTTDDRLELPQQFDMLDEQYFSLGQSTEYYETIQSLNEELKISLLLGLRDIVFDEVLQNKALREDVTGMSLLRDTSWRSVKGQYKRILNGGAVVTKFNFTYETQQSTQEAGLKLEFNVDPESNPPTNIHVLIGRNGVGKTHLLNNMVKTLIQDKSNTSGVFSFIEDDFGDDSESFAGVVSVSYSAFDPFKPYDCKDIPDGFRYSYVGLKKNVDKDTELKNSFELAYEFLESTQHCFSIGKKEKWKRAVDSLSSDPLFARMNISEKIDETWDKPRILAFFHNLSSGHAIVLLIITKLVETIEEKTLVLLDEPEGHLHPPLLSAFIRALSELLTDRNAIALIATHSPIVAQEIPNNCIWNLSRFGKEAKAERLDIETFGENVGILTHEIFGLEVTSTGFYKMLKDDVEAGMSIQDILVKYNNKLGSEAKFLIQTLMLNNE